MPRQCSAEISMKTRLFWVSEQQFKMANWRRGNTYSNNLIHNILKKKKGHCEVSRSEETDLLIEETMKKGWRRVKKNRWYSLVWILFILFQNEVLSHALSLSTSRTYVRFLDFSPEQPLHRGRTHPEKQMGTNYSMVATKKHNISWMIRIRLSKTSKGEVRA